MTVIAPSLALFLPLLSVIPAAVAAGAAGIAVAGVATAILSAPVAAGELVVDTVKLEIYRSRDKKENEALKDLENGESKTMSDAVFRQLVSFFTTSAVKNPMPSFLSAKLYHAAMTQ